MYYLYSIEITIKNTYMKVFIIKSKIIYLNLDSDGWYIEVNDGYCSNYYSTKSEALQRVKEIKNEIKNNNW